MKIRSNSELGAGDAGDLAVGHGLRVRPDQAGARRAAAEVVALRGKPRVPPPSLFLIIFLKGKSEKIKLAWPEKALNRKNRKDARKLVRSQGEKKERIR